MLGHVKNITVHRPEHQIVFRPFALKQLQEKLQRTNELKQFLQH